MATTEQSLAALLASTTALMASVQQVITNARGADGVSLKNRGPWSAGTYQPGDYVLAPATIAGSSAIWFLIDTVPYASSAAPRTDFTHWLELPALRGADGVGVELQVNATHIQWRLTGASTWTNLIALSLLKGAPGNDGVPGVWLVGTTVPTATLGKNTDLYVNSITGDVYGPKANGAWGGITFNIKGPPGTGSGSGTGAWRDLTGSYADNVELKAALDGKEAYRQPGSAAQYWAGDKTLQNLNKAAVGLAKADNTSDAEKPVSNAVATALEGKEPKITGGAVGQYRDYQGVWRNLPTGTTGGAAFPTTPEAAAQWRAAIDAQSKEEADINFAVQLATNLSAMTYLQTIVLESQNV